MLTATLIAYAAATLLILAGVFSVSLATPARRTKTARNARLDREQLLDASLDTYGREVA